VTETEGVIQFAYALTPGDPGLASTAFAELAAWRSVLRDLDLLGEHPDRYDGHGYGNLSVRDSRGDFVITASQTSGKSSLMQGDLVRISKVELREFRVDAIGSKAPSSESLTHAMLYRADPGVQVVFHVHSPLIWRQHAELQLPATPADVPYGTPAMAEAVSALTAAQPQRPLLFVTAGHEDGVFAVGASARDCGALLVACLADARAASA
jgi:hypothetical protein